MKTPRFLSGLANLFKEAVRPAKPKDYKDPGTRLGVVETKSWYRDNEYIKPTRENVLAILRSAAYDATTAEERDAVKEIDARIMKVETKTMGEERLIRTLRTALKEAIQAAKDEDLISNFRIRLSHVKSKKAHKKAKADKAAEDKASKKAERKEVKKPPQRLQTYVAPKPTQETVEQTDEMTDRQHLERIRTMEKGQMTYYRACNICRLLPYAKNPKRAFSLTIGRAGRRGYQHRYVEDDPEKVLRIAKKLIAEFNTAPRPKNVRPRALSVSQAPTPTPAPKSDIRGRGREKTSGSGNTAGFGEVTGRPFRSAPAKGHEASRLQYLRGVRTELSGGHHDAIFQPRSQWDDDDEDWSWEPAPITSEPEADEIPVSPRPRRRLVRDIETKS